VVTGAKGEGAEPVTKKLAQIRKLLDENMKLITEIEKLLHEIDDIKQAVEFLRSQSRVSAQEARKAWDKFYAYGLRGDEIHQAIHEHFTCATDEKTRPGYTDPTGIGPSSAA